MVVELYTEQVKNISIDDLKNLMKSGKGMMVLDAREISAYCKGHVPGACDLFDAEIESLAPERVEKGAMIVVYGPGQAQPSPDFMDRLAGDAIDRLKKLGFQNLMELKGGYEAWANAGNRVDMCTEKSITPAKVPLFHRTESGVRSL